MEMLQWFAISVISIGVLTLTAQLGFLIWMMFDMFRRYK